MVNINLHGKLKQPMRLAIHIIDNSTIESIAFEIMVVNPAAIWQTLTRKGPCHPLHRASQMLRCPLYKGSTKRERYTMDSISKNSLVTESLSHTGTFCHRHRPSRARATPSS